MKRAVLVLIAVCCVTLTFANGQGEKAAVKPTIRFAYEWVDEPGFVQHLEQFVADNSDFANYELEGTPGEDHRTKVKVDIAANNAPDIFAYWAAPGELQEYKNAGILLDVDRYFEASQEVSADLWPASAFTGYILDDGARYGLPIVKFFGSFIVNRDLFQKYSLAYPETYDMLLKAVDVFKANGIIPIDMASKGGNPSHLFYNMISYQLEGGLEVADNLYSSKIFKAESTTQAARVVQELVDRGAFPPDTIASGGWDMVHVLYTDEKAAMTMVFDWTVGAIDVNVQNKSEVIAFPKMPEAVRDPADFSVGGTVFGYCINKKSFDDPKKRDAIIRMVDFLLSRQTLQVAVDERTSIPPMNIKLDYSKLDPLFSKTIAFSMRQSGLYNPTAPRFPSGESRHTYLDTLDELWAGSITAEEFVDAVQKSLGK